MTQASSPTAPAHRRVRVGFISKFFGLFEPHGLLLDGAMEYLPRHVFEVWALPVVRTDGKPLAHTIAAGVDHVVEVSRAMNCSICSIFVVCTQYYACDLLSLTDESTPYHVQMSTDPFELFPRASCVELFKAGHISIRRHNV